MCGAFSVTNSSDAIASFVEFGSSANKYAKRNCAR